MYLDAKRILYVVTALILGLMGWWFVEMKNAATEEMIREIETGIPSDKKITAQVEAFDQAMNAIKTALGNADYGQAAKLLRDQYYAIESLTYRGDQIELQDGRNFNDWLEAVKTEWNAGMEVAYPRMVAALKKGHLSPETAESFFRTVPHPFGSPWTTRFREDRESIEVTRTARAENWVLVWVGASTGHGSLFEDAIRPEIQKKWPADAEYQLVLGRAMSREEEAAAAKMLQFYISGETVRYVREGSDNPLAGYDLLETVHLEVIDRTRNPMGPELNWTSQDPITVTHKPAESFFFKLEHEGQSIDFESIQLEQIQQLVTLLRQATQDQLPEPAFSEAQKD